MNCQTLTITLPAIVVRSTQQAMANSLRYAAKRNADAECAQEFEWAADRYEQLDPQEFVKVALNYLRDLKNARQ